MEDGQMNYPIRIVSGAVCFFLACSVIASAQWNKKPFGEWSQKDTQKVLNDSPWGQTQAFTNTSNRFSTGPGTTAATTAPPEASTDYLYVRIRFLSARPIRQALSRYAETQNPPPDEKALARLKGFIETQFTEHIVMSVLAESRDHKGQLQGVLAALRNRTTAELKNNTYLVLKNGQRVFLQEYYPLSSDGLGAKFVFPRLVEGKPFITEESGEVLFYSELDGLTLRMRFKIKDMIYDGKLEY